MARRNSRLAGNAGYIAPSATDARAIGAVESHNDLARQPAEERSTYALSADRLRARRTALKYVAPSEAHEATYRVIGSDHHQPPRLDTPTTIVTAMVVTQITAATSSSVRLAESPWGGANAMV